MARLDCSFLGRPIERFGKPISLDQQEGKKSFDLDLGFAAYVSYLHMEVTHTNPIMLGEFVGDMFYSNVVFRSFLLFYV